jgi:hypothetical protein
MLKILLKISPIRAMLFWLFILTLHACQSNSLPTTVTPSLPPPLPATTNPVPTHPLGLTQDQILTLESLQMVDEYPLYVMHYYADHETSELPADVQWDVPRATVSQGNDQDSKGNWGCSLFAAFGDVQQPLFGRNFDWDYSPVMLLYTHPKLSHTSVSLVDLTYLVGDQADQLLDLPFEQRLPLLQAPDWPFDGMNDCGLVIGMAAVPASQEPQIDPQKTSIGSLQIMREILDHACTVDEAVELMDSYNISLEGGPELHYLIAEGSGRAVLVEYFQGSMRIIPNQNPWHLATNFYISAAGNNPQGVCHRYDTIAGVMQDNSGKLSSQQAMHLLSQVSQDMTQWSVVYNAVNGEVQIVVGRDYADPYPFELEMKPSTGRFPLATGVLHFIQDDIVPHP